MLFLLVTQCYTLLSKPHDFDVSTNYYINTVETVDSDKGAVTTYYNVSDFMCVKTSGRFGIFKSDWYQFEYQNSTVRINDVYHVKYDSGVAILYL